MVKIAQKRPQRAYLLLFLLATGVGVLAIVAQVSRPTKTIGRDTWTILPARDWGIAIGNQAGFWDEKDPKTHQAAGGRIYVYGFVERWTNT